MEQTLPFHKVFPWRDKSKHLLDKKKKVCYVNKTLLVNSNCFWRIEQQIKEAALRDRRFSSATAHKSNGTINSTSIAVFLFSEGVCGRVRSSTSIAPSSCGAYCRGFLKTLYNLLNNASLKEAVKLKDLEPWKGTTVHSQTDGHTDAPTHNECHRDETTEGLWIQKTSLQRCPHCFQCSAAWVWMCIVIWTSQSLWIDWRDVIRHEALGYLIPAGNVFSRGKMQRFPSHSESQQVVQTLPVPEPRHTQWKIYTQYILLIVCSALYIFSMMLYNLSAGLHCVVLL